MSSGELPLPRYVCIYRLSEISSFTVVENVFTLTGRVLTQTAEFFFCITSTGITVSNRMQYGSFRKTSISKLNFASGRIGRMAGPAISTLVKLSLILCVTFMLCLTLELIFSVLIFFFSLTFSSIFLLHFVYFLVFFYLLRSGTISGNCR